MNSSFMRMSVATRGLISYVTAYSHNHVLFYILISIRWFTHKFSVMLSLQMCAAV